MICSTCGCDNPEKLIFCQECGQRLAPRVAPPTPPIGVGSPYIAPPESSGGNAAPGPTVHAPLSAGAPPGGAPARRVGPPPLPPLSDASGPATHAEGLHPDGPPTTIRCPRCNANNEPKTRFCVSCGHAIDPSARPRAAPAPNAPPPVFVPAPVAKANEPIAPVPMVDLRPAPPAAAPAPPRNASPAPLPAPAPIAAPMPAPLPAPIASPAPVPLPAPPLPAPPLPAPPLPAPPLPAPPPREAVPAPSPQDAQRVCARCRGASEASAQFCKYCGAPFGSVRPPVPPAPPTMPQVPGGLSQSGANPAAAARGGARPAPAAAAPAPAPAPAPSLDVGTPALGVAVLSPPQAPGNSTSGKAASPAGPTPLIPPAMATSQFQGVELVAQVRPTGRLVAITKDGAEGASYPIFEQLDIGRTEGDVAVPEDRYLSTRHARIVRKTLASGEVQLVLRDLGSVNGVFLRVGNAMAGDGRVEVELRDQDLFLVGQQVLKFEAVKDGEDGLGPATEHGTLLFGTPQAPRYARLVQRTVEGVGRDVFHVRKVETVLGRESGDIVFTDDPFLSRRHAVIKVDRDNQRFLLADLGSSNGTFIQIHGDVTLKSGDQFRIGQQLFRVELNRAQH